MRNSESVFLRWKCLLTVAAVGTVLLVSCSGSSRVPKTQPNGSSSQPSADEPTEVTRPSRRMGGDAEGKQVQARLIIYKTHGDYRLLVPVTLDREQQRIVSYPAPSDLRHGGEYPYPTQLANGYLLDNRGITAHDAFTAISYETYAGKDEVTTLWLQQNMQDRTPFTEFYDCGIRDARNPQAQAARMVQEGFAQCKKISTPRPIRIRR